MPAGEMIGKRAESMAAVDSLMSAPARALGASTILSCAALHDSPCTCA
ncbi:MAG TPA: hypothetical protein VJY34_00520 [Roseiarcus sp.]|nr:hypothetical protein [Roseiarcus sp.]